jgi:aminoglycoside 6-adenylyltransferase
MEEIRRRSVAWGERAEGVQAMILTGSYARGEPDEYSDLDISIFGDGLERYADDLGWLGDVGEVWMCLHLHVGDGYPSRLVIFEGGRKVDYTFWPMGELELMVGTRRLDELYERAYTVLLDKTGLAARLPPPRRRHHARPAPDADEFRRAVEEFWFEAWHVAKYLARADLFHAKVRDGATKRLLLRMIEWRERGRSGDWDRDTKYLGIGMRRWAAPSTWRELGTTFGHFHAGDAWRALFATQALFQRLGREVAATAGFEYPEAFERNVAAVISGMRRARRPPRGSSAGARTP